jgi:hypothetical protein
VIFDAEIGLQSILGSDTRNVRLDAAEKLAGGPDQALYVVSGDLLGDRVYQMSGRLIGPDEMTFSAWVLPETFELIRVVVTDPPETGAEEPTIWQLDFSEFGRVVPIEPPE